MGFRRLPSSFLAVTTMVCTGARLQRARRRQLNLASMRTLASLLLLVFFTGSVSGTSLRQMDLKGLIQNSDRIFRATVLSVEKRSVQAGGGTIPTVTYHLEIVDSFKGQQTGITKVTMVASPKESSTEDGVKRFPLFQDVPRLEKGKDYVLFVTRPSSLGLSTTVGLGQGCFNVLLQGNKEYAVNLFNNAGLGLKAKAGPVPYEELAAAIQSQDSK